MTKEVNHTRTKAGGDIIIISFKSPITGILSFEPTFHPVDDAGANLLHTIAALDVLRLDSSGERVKVITKSKDDKSSIIKIIGTLISEPAEHIRALQLASENIVFRGDTATFADYKDSVAGADATTLIDMPLDED